MIKFALALVVALMLSVSGSAWATTFKDGVISSDNVVEKPAVDSTSNGKTGLVGKILAGCVGERGYSKETHHQICKDFKHNKCAKLEMENRGLTCDMNNIASNQVASTNNPGLLTCVSSQDAYWHNCQGTEILSDGTKYVGEYRDGKRNGQFIVTYADGDKYVGDFRDNVFNGQGTYTYADGGEYVGEFHDDKIHGQGTEILSDGTKYIGEYRDGKRNGRFIVTYADGGKYVGDFRDDVFNGKGTYTYPSGSKYFGEWKDDKTHGQGTEILSDGTKYVGEYSDGKRNGQFIVTYADGDKYVGDFRDDVFNGKGTYTYPTGSKYVGEWKGDKIHGQGIFIFADGRAAKEGVWRDGEFQYIGKQTSSDLTQIITTLPKPSVSSAELNAERKKRIQVEQELASLKALQKQQHENIAADVQSPVLTAKVNFDGSMAYISGSAADNIGVAELLVDGLPVRLSSDGSFETSFYVPRNGKQVEVKVFDLKGNKTTKTLSLQRSTVQQASGPVFGSLNPSGKRVMPNNDALALIIGVADYERTLAKAAYADKDAKTFYDYAMLKLGIPASNIKELVNDSASEIDVRLAVKDWIARSTKQNASDIYVFFAGHGLASQSGEEMYLLPFDGEPRLLEDSAIRRTRLFDDIAFANPRSVTVFLDTCYSGTTRGTDMLIASRPIAIKALKQSVPDNFTVMTAAAGDQTAKPLEEAKHGMFSYFLMKGMEGEADANQDNKITAGELHSYVRTNVIQQSSGSQTPELQGDADRVLVQFQ